MKDTAMGKTIIKDLQFIDEQLDLVISILEFEESEKMSDAFNRVFDFALTTITMGYAQYKEDITDERLKKIAEIFIENDIGVKRKVVNCVLCVILNMKVGDCEHLMFLYSAFF